MFLLNFLNSFEFSDFYKVEIKIKYKDLKNNTSIESLKPTLTAASTKCKGLLDEKKLRLRQNLIGKRLFFFFNILVNIKKVTIIRLN